MNSSTSAPSPASAYPGNKGALAPPPLVADSVVGGRYRLVRLLGEGGMGVVWEAVHVVTRRAVALKFLKSSRDGGAVARARFLREARVMSAVDHPGVVAVHDVLALEGESLCLVMDLLRGESLAARLAREGALALREVASIILPVCAALSAAHSRGVVHRDMKPDNIFLAEGADGTTSVKVLDFGIAKVMLSAAESSLAGSLTTGPVVVGTPAYMAPEQLLGDATLDQRSDLWALGATLYEALTGVVPIEADGMAQLVKRVLLGEITPVEVKAPGLPAPVASLVMRLMRPNRTHRPDSVDEVVKILSPYARQASLGTGPSRGLSDSVSGEDFATAPTAEAVLPRSVVDPRRRRRWTIASVASVVVAMLSSSFAARTHPVVRESAAEPAFGVATSRPDSAENAPMPDTPPLRSIAAPVSPVSQREAPTLALRSSGGGTARRPLVEVASSVEAASQSCSPPFSYDAAGLKHFRPECP